MARGGGNVQRKSIYKQRDREHLISNKYDNYWVS